MNVDFALKFRIYRYLKSVICLKGILKNLSARVCLCFDCTPLYSVISVRLENSCTQTKYSCPVHKQSTVVMYTNKVQLSCTQTKYSCPVHKLSTVVLYTNKVQLSCTQTKYSCPYLLFIMQKHYRHIIQPLTVSINKL